MDYFLLNINMIWMEHQPGGLEKPWKPTLKQR